MNSNECKHGSQARQCLVCEYFETIVELKSQVARLNNEITGEGDMIVDLEDEITDLRTQLAAQAKELEECRAVLRDASVLRRCDICRSVTMCPACRGCLTCDHGCINACRLAKALGVKKPESDNCELSDRNIKVTARSKVTP